MNFAQIFNVANLGLVILDRYLKVAHWNPWMEIHTGVAADKIMGASIFDFFPNLRFPGFEKNCKSVFTFGNLAFFSQKLHHYLFPCKPVTSFNTRFDYMQQSCTMGPLRDEKNKGKIEHLYIIVQDVTELVAFEQKLIEMNNRDGLTRIYNRRFMDKRLKEEFESHRRYSRPFSLIMFDIDHFKEINDRYGHQCGDFILKSISSRIDSSIRNVDFLARYGGEEFCCMLPETNLHTASKLDEGFRLAVSEKKFNFNGYSVKVTISLGVSEISEGIASPEILLKRADEALYEAKKSGRNRIVSMKTQQSNAY